MDNQNKVIEIAGKHLGQVGGAGYKDTYDPSLLVRIPRTLNRESYGLTGEEFTGVDVWNAYEVSVLTNKNLPVSGMMKITVPSETPYHVESKSIKLYLNSFNMTKLGDNTSDAIRLFEETVAKDLTELLEGEVTVRMFTNQNGPQYAFEGYQELGAITNLDNIDFNTFKSDASQLSTLPGTNGVMKVTTDLLRSNCRVTNQPDWGDLFIHMEGGSVPSNEALAKYVVSHRQVSHFHEEIVEMTFTHLMEAYDPKKLMVCALYTRRGGIDINPIRATHKGMIPVWFTDLNCRMAKTLRQ